LVLKRKCIVCGKIFPDGQGIVLVRETLVLEFHSRRCMVKFFKRVFEEAPDINCIREYIEKLVKEYKEIAVPKQKMI